MASNRSAPSATVVPVLGYDDVGRAVDWLCAAFGVAGHRWTFSPPVADVAPEDWSARVRSEGR